MWLLTRSEPREIVNLDNGTRIKVERETTQYEISVTYIAVSQAQAGKISLGAYPDQDAAHHAFEDLAGKLQALDMDTADLRQFMGSAKANRLTAVPSAY